MALLPEPVTESWTPSSEFEKGAVQQQLEHLLGSPLFNSSKRYGQFLRFVVTRALDGQAGQLKERILGIEIFERPADYDTNTDPIVRVTAAEIRKRIDQYYQDPKHSQEIRLFLPAGSYAPQFSWPGHPNGFPETIALSPDTGTAVLRSHRNAGRSVPAASKRFSNRAKIIVLLGALVLTLAAAGILWRQSRPTLVQQFWEPFVNSPEPTLFCMADQAQYASIRLRDANDPQKETTLPDTMVAVIIDDVDPLVNIAGILRSSGKNYRVLGESTTTLTDLRGSPSVFIGAFDNGWTLRLTAPLRFHFANDASISKLWIEDRAAPGKRDWLLDRSQQQTEDYKDYAIVARFVAPDTDQLSVVAAGIGRGGTVAAGEFLVDENRMEEMSKQLPADWEKKNIEVVLETQVIQGRSGPPRVQAVHTW
ncbi:MAG TPA: hypothetical protein VMG82_24465 [Candidatus Sulfotelmatobacter sp.]|nr:hypothetical protein [Candidatus Sulfotelmatobacter sp.]